MEAIARGLIPSARMPRIALPPRPRPRREVSLRPFWTRPALQTARDTPASDIQLAPHATNQRSIMEYCVRATLQ
eukprot:9505117-Alexandrium_andersonii.AAC.1